MAVVTIMGCWLTSEAGNWAGQRYFLKRPGPVQVGRGGASS